MDQEDDNLIYRFFGGCTCNTHVSIEKDYGKHVLFHHHAHPSYIDRMSGSKTCEAYHVLVKKDMEFTRGLNRFWAESDGILYFQGRMNKERWFQIDQALAIATGILVKEIAELKLKVEGLENISVNLIKAIREGTKG